MARVNLVRVMVRIRVRIRVRARLGLGLGLGWCIHLTVHLEDAGDRAVLARDRVGRWHLIFVRVRVRVRVRVG